MVTYRGGDAWVVAGTPARFRLVVLIEFTGVGAEQTFALAFPDRPVDRIIAIDPLEVPPNGTRPMPLPVRVAHIAGAVAGAARRAGAPEVVLVAACTGTSMLVPVASRLSALEVPVAGVVAVDPQPVSSPALGDVLGGLVRRLGAPEDQESPRARAIAEIPDPGRMCRVAADWLTACGDEYIDCHACDEDEAALIREDVVPRYIAWFEYLVSTCAATGPSRPGRPIDIVLSEGANLPDGVLGSENWAKLHRFDTGGRAPLRDDVVGEFLRTLVGCADLGGTERTGGS
jgi:hypothetical protein